MVQPMGARVLISRLPAPKPASSLLIVPESVSDKPSQFAVVLAVGSKVREKLSVGDTVILRDFSGAAVPAEMADGIDNGFIVPEDDILMRIEE